MTDPRSFGAWLQRERERRDITVRAIADRTKIGVGLLQSLERGDVSRWPGGIYRRSFVRSYAEAIGIDPDLVLANFERLFPDPEALSAFDRSDAAAQAPAVPRVPFESGGLRLQLASPARPGRAAVRTACVDVAFVVCAGLIGFLAAGVVGFWSATAVSALTCHVCSVLGLRRAIRAPLAAALHHWTARHARAREMVADLAEIPEAQADPALDLTYYAR
jgi:transcriptional regulator with XRE-family HTH domain